MNQDKMQMFVERYLELSNELKYRKGESGAYMQLGEILTQKGDYDTSTKHFYRAMKISEDVKDDETNEKAKVNFGMANASLKWNNHVTGLLEQIEKTTKIEDQLDDQVNEQVDEVSPEDEYDGN
jgi:tetratricopeptide (TPR) repeat protein